MEVYVRWAYPLLDRVAQQMVRDHLEMQLEPLFHESSFWYRSGRSSHDAVAESQRNCFNHDFAIDLDIHRTLTPLIMI